MKAKAKIWIAGYLILTMSMLLSAGSQVVKVDPFFHYHKPNTDIYYYEINNERSQNDGIIKHFEYNALITGTSMTENFKTSEMNNIFGVNSVKVPFSGGSYKEINDNLDNALSNNSELKIVVRGLDTGKFIIDKDNMRSDMGEYPTYLYDNNLFNDVKYVFNRDVLFNRVYTMVTANDYENFQPGIDSFDEYSNWMDIYIFGIKTVSPDGVVAQDAGKPVHLSEEEREIVLGTVYQNITSLAEKYPDVTFYYFFTPYSIIWWKDLVDAGTVYRQVEAEKLVIEEILQCENIKLYSFNNLPYITTDLNHYKDTHHYASWINSLMLRYMKDGKGLLTLENYEQYLEEELAFYTTYDYSRLNEQVDYENDYYAEALLNQEISGVAPLPFSEDILKSGELNSAHLVYDQHNGTVGLECRGSLQRESESEISITDYIILQEHIGDKIRIEDISDYRYLVFYGRKNQDHGQPRVYIYDESYNVLAEFAAKYEELDNNWHQYMIDVSKLSGAVTIVFHGGYTDRTGSADSSYTFSDITLY